jgi:hypothetical protein
LKEENWIEKLKEGEEKLGLAYTWHSQTEADINKVSKIIKGILI